jgi:tRNA modification GTPase
LARLAAGIEFVPRQARLATLRDGAGTPIDTALVVPFVGPASFTGEDVVELHVTGGRAVVARLLSVLDEMPELVPAAPGAFARRAFDNGKLDLTRAEGLADLVEAETEAQRVRALRQARGGLAEKAEDWRRRLIAALAEIEASLDFGEDEADVSANMVADQAPVIAALEREIVLHLGRAEMGERLARGVTIAITGAPNAGKSTLMNALAGREVAIVSELAGTTRDAIEVHLDLGGVPVVLVDTAGIRETADPVEAEGVRRARARAAAADIVVELVGPGEAAAPGALRVLAKADIVPSDRLGGLAVSARSGAGMDALVTDLAGRAAALAGIGEDVLVTSLRQRQSLERVQEALQAAGAEDDEVLRAENLRRALVALGELTGRVSVDSILDIVFGRFCIGK